MKNARELAYRTAVFVKRKTDPAVSAALDLLERGEAASRAEMEVMRVGALQRLLRHCQDHVPYFREIMRQRGIRAEAVTSLEVLRQFPVLTKEAIRRDGSSMVADTFASSDYEKRSSSGTTGEPVSSLLDRATSAIETYAALRGMQWMGWRPWMKTIRLWGGSLGRFASPTLRTRLRSLVLGEVPLPAFEINARTAPEYARVIQNAGPSVLVGYSSAVYILAQEVAKLEPRTWPLQVLFPTAAEMPAEWARAASRVFGCPVRRYFGCAEVNSLGFQLTDEGPYVVPDEHVVLETVQPGTPEAGVVPPGSLLITSLYNRVRPLIRYANGDLADIAPPGELHPVRSCIRELHGRSPDMFVLRDGTRLSANLCSKTITQLKPPVKRFQFIQHDYEQVEFRYEPVDRELTPGELNAIITTLRSHMSPDLQVNVRKTDEFILSRGDKLRTMICRVPATAPSASGAAN